MTVFDLAKKIIILLLILNFINTKLRLENGETEFNGDNYNANLSVIMTKNFSSKNIKAGGLKATGSLCEPSKNDQYTQEIINEYIKSKSLELSQEDIKLIKFIASDCLPVVIVPGLYGNKLQLHITNCTAINEHHPEIAIACGYDKKCINGDEKMFFLSENFEKNDNTTCLGELSKLNIITDETQTIRNKKFIEMPYFGFRLVYWGNTPKTQNESECGFGASSDVLDKLYYFGNKSPHGLKYIKEHFLNLGYQIGINLFSVPYDWRRHSNDPFNFASVKETVDLAFNLTGKPCILIGHSYGSTISLNYIYNLSEEEKNIKINRFIGVGPLFNGVHKAVSNIILGNQDFNIKVKILFVTVVDIFFSIQNQKIYLYKTPSIAEMLPRLFWNLNKDEDFMYGVLNRTYVEDKITDCVRNYFNEKTSSNKLKFLEEEINLKFNKTLPSEDDEILNSCILPIKNSYQDNLKIFKDNFPYFPDLDSGCTVRKMSEVTCIDSKNCRNSIWDEYCRLNFFLPYNNPLLKVKDGDKEHKFDLLTKENILEMIDKFGIGDNKKNLEYIDYLYDLINPAMHKLDHPKVPVTIFYNTDSKTVTYYRIPQNPKIITDKNLFAGDVLGQDIEKLAGGDGTIPSTSTLLAPLKWSAMSNFDKTNQPVHLINYCTNATFSNKEVDFTQNQYFNIGCQCTEPHNEACSHSGMIGDPSLLDTITKYSVSDKNKLSREKLNHHIDLVSKGISHVEKDMMCSNLKRLNEQFDHLFFK